MNEIKIKAMAKINLSLDVTGVRDNGYHDVKMIMQSINLYDEIILRKKKEAGIQLSVNKDIDVEPENNIAYKAAALIMKEYNIDEGISIELVKNIPVAAGMAGGSTDAAAVLKGINELFGLGANEKKLMELGVKLGADVPYCIMLGTALSEGIGEILSKLPPMPECCILIAKPSQGVSTQYVYRKLDEIGIKKHPDVDGMVDSLKAGNLEGIVNRLGNVLEAVTIKECPVIEDIKRNMCDNGAMGALMSGSGPTVFGIFRDADLASKAAKHLEATKMAKDIIVTSPYNN